MIRSLFTRRGAAAFAAAAIGVAGMSLAFAGTAGAALPTPASSSGAARRPRTAVMTTLSDVFNNAAGCDLTASTSSSVHPELWHVEHHPRHRRW